MECNIDWYEWIGYNREKLEGGEIRVGVWRGNGISGDRSNLSEW